MRLARYEQEPKRKIMLVGEALPPVWATTPELQRSFAEIHRRLDGRLHDHAERSLGREDARDAVADAWASLWPRWPSLSLEHRPDRYFFGVVTFCVYAKRKENRRFVSIDGAGPVLDRRAIAATDSFGSTRGDSGADVLDAALTAMPARRREVLLLIREQGFSHPEAAEMLGLKIGTINHHMHLAMQDVRAAFARAGIRLTASQTRSLLKHSPEGGDTND